MFKFTKTGVFYFAIIIAFFMMQIFIHKYSIKTEVNDEIMEMQDVPKIKTEQKNEIWQIKIPKISLIAEISEGTEKEKLNKYVGHFENTPKEQGNVGLAINNNNIKQLKEGEKIIYKHNNFEKIYEIEKCRIIKKDELEYLDETEENMLTLITYVKNEPEYRRCVQAVEQEER